MRRLGGLVVAVLVLAGCSASNGSDGGPGPAPDATPSTSASQVPDDGAPQLYVRELSGLPEPTGEAAAVWTGERLYVFGGRGRIGITDAIIEVDVETGESTRLAQRLPVGLRGACAAWDGTHAYLFGGLDASGYPSDAIYRFDPATGQVDRMEARVGPLWRCAAVHAWGSMYILGGSGATENDSNEVLRFAPEEGVVLAGRLPEPVTQASAVWTGEAIFLLGGTGRTVENGSTRSWHSNRIIGVDRNGTTWTEEARLPGPLAAKWSSAAVWDGETAYLIGGQQAGLTQSKRVLAFNPANGTTWREPVSLPYEVTGPVAVWTGSTGLVLGGFVDGQPTPRVVRLSHLA